MSVITVLNLIGMNKSFIFISKRNLADIQSCENSSEFHWNNSRLLQQM